MMGDSLHPAEFWSFARRELQVGVPHSAGCGFVCDVNDGVFYLQFEWDEEKNKINKAKHGISFETAAKVFEDPYYLEVYDTDHSNIEDRYIAIGMVEDILFVVFTERKDKVRLISARLATAIERSYYYDGRI